MDMSRSAWERVKGFFQSRSPSRLMMWLGRTLPQGLGVGIVKDTKKAVAAAVSMARRVTKGAASIAAPEVSVAGPSARITPATGTAATPAPVLSTRPAGSSTGGVSVSVGGLSVSIGSIGNAGNLDEAERVTQEDVKKQIRAAFEELRKSLGSTPTQGVA